MYVCIDRPSVSAAVLREVWPDGKLGFKTTLDPQKQKQEKHSDATRHKRSAAQEIPLQKLEGHRRQIAPLLYGM